ncbi:MAG: methyl-accepting chemotaxis protein [Sphingomonadaceae bacterium]
MKLRHLLPLSFTVAVLISVGSGLAGAFLLHRTVQASGDAVQDCFAKERAVGYLAVVNQAKELAWSAVLANGADDADRARHWRATQQLEQALSSKGAALLPTLTPASGARLDAFLRRHAQVVTAHQQAYQAFQADPARARRDDSGAAAATGALLAQTIDQLKDDSAAITAAATNGSRTTLYAISGVMGLICFAILIASTLFSRTILRPITSALEMARAIASGDLRSRIDVRSANELGEMSGSLREMNGALTHIVAEVRGCTEQIVATSASMEQGNARLSARTEAQASALEQTASSMEQLSSTVHQNASNARNANQLALQASAEASAGGVAVADVVRTMQGIQGSAQKIADIIVVIDSIAFQTNILALNAAVEAARAGAQGQGFAVVAVEVRNLAQRSAQAAREINALIAASMGEVQQGVTLVAHAGSTIDRLVGSVQRVSSIVAEIARASDEQSLGVEQISGAVSEMDRVTQENAAMVEQASAAAASLRSQADTLQQAVSIFKLEQASAVRALR